MGNMILISKNPSWRLTGSALTLPGDVQGLQQDYPVVSIEDPFDQDDWLVMPS